MPNGDIHYVGAVQKADKESFFKANCEVGKYVCSVYTPWKSFANEITLVAYGVAEVQINNIMSKDVPPNFYKNLVKSKASLDKLEGKDYSSQGEPNIKYKFEHSGDGFGYFFFENYSQATTIE